MSNLNILLISRIIFPALSPRSFRTTELAKALAKQGHNVTLYAVLGETDYSDFEKETGVKVRNIGKMFLGSSDSEGKFRYTLLDKILYHSLHRFIEYPDIELMIRIPKIIKKERGADLLITIAHPHPIHWGAALSKKLLSKKKFPAIWVSDCGDPYFGDPMNKKKFFYFKYIEKWWGNKTDFITIPLKEAKTGYSKYVQPKIRIIPQGFDFENVKIDRTFIRNKIPVFAYAGSIYPGQRDPKAFLTFLTTLDMNFKFIIYTSNTAYYSDFKKSLKNKLELKSYIPRDQLIYELSQIDFLINLKNPNAVQMPSKIIDYLQSTRPILEVSSNFPHNEKEKFMEFSTGNYTNQLIGFDIKEFNIENVAKKFIDLYYENKR